MCRFVRIHQHCVLPEHCVLPAGRTNQVPAQFRMGGPAMSNCGNASVIGGRASKAPAPAAARFRRQTHRGLSSRSWLCKPTRPPSCLALAVAVMAPANVNASAQEADADADSGSSGLITFFSTRDGDYKIYLMNPDCSGLSRLINSPSDDSEPAWSPVCSRIAFTSLLEREQDIYLINTHGSGPLQRCVPCPSDIGFAIADFR